jgi:lauroyl/myristoyl acyltransferase
MPQALPQPKAGFKDYPSRGIIAFFRRLERAFSPGKLYAVLRPLYFTRSVLNTVFKKNRPGPPVPDFLRSPRNRRTNIADRTNLYLNSGLLNFPDRLAAPKWLANCQVEGLAHLQAARRAGRPVVLAFFHFGAFPIAHCWLRGGLNFPVVGVVGGNSGMRTQLARHQDRLMPLPEVPVTIYLDQLREMVRLFAAGNILLMSVDSPTGKQMVVPFCAGWDFRMATGGIRFAARHQADIIPCAITNEDAWHYRITLGRPASRELLADEASWPQVGQHLLEEMMPVFKAHPHQCWDAMTRRLVRKTDDAAKS